MNDLKPLISAIEQNRNCVWVGAGATSQLASVVIDWNKLVTDAESEARITPNSGSDYPTRLDASAKILGIDRFQKIIRKSVIDPLYHSIIKSIKERLANNDFSVPENVRQLAAIGRFANTIINFNIEILTSIIIAEPQGPYRMRFFTAKEQIISGKKQIRGFADSMLIYRNVLHPHGALEYSGPCIITATDYSDLKANLAFQLSIHHAFDDNLIIIGMSLEDQYLRDQISNFRDYLHGIYWVNSQRALDRHKDWIKNTRIEGIAVNWSDFWKQLEYATLSAAKRADREFQISTVGRALDDKGLISAWRSVCLHIMHSVYSSNQEMATSLTGYDTLMSKYYQDLAIDTGEPLVSSVTEADMKDLIQYITKL